jgi:hypothetical protein
MINRENLSLLSNNEGYDLICMHPDSRVSGPKFRIQVKSRLATDCDRGFPVKGKTLDAFDYFICLTVLKRLARH